MSERTVLGRQRFAEEEAPSNGTEFYSLACKSGQFTSKLPTVWIQIPSLMVSDDVLLKEDNLY